MEDSSGEINATELGTDWEASQNVSGKESGPALFVPVVRNPEAEAKLCRTLHMMPVSK